MHLFAADPVRGNVLVALKTIPQGQRAFTLVQRAHKASIKALQLGLGVDLEFLETEGEYLLDSNLASWLEDFREQAYNNGVSASSSSVSTAATAATCV